MQLAAVDGENFHWFTDAFENGIVILAVPTAIRKVKVHYSYAILPQSAR